MPTLIMARGTVFFGLLTYYFQFYGDGGADGLSMFFFIIIAGLSCLGFLVAFLGVLFFTNKGDTVFKMIISGIVLLTVCFVLWKTFDTSHITDYEIETNESVEKVVN
jgi:fatty acid desaturase